MTPAERQRRYRQRRKAKESVAGVRVTPLVRRALAAQGVDAGLTEEQAEAESHDHERVAVLLGAVTEGWARGYLARRKRYA